MRVYVTEGYNFAQRDIGSASDPYLVLTCGNQTINDKDNYKLDESNPQFYKHFDFLVNFPGAPLLEIKAMDYDDLFGDDLIGQTSIDLDNRHFSPEWRSIQDKPIEHRHLYIPGSKL